MVYRTSGQCQLNLALYLQETFTKTNFMNTIFKQFDKNNIQDGFLLGKSNLKWVFEKVSWHDGTVCWHIDNFPDFCYQATVNGKLIGFSLGFIEGDIGYVSWIVVENNFRRQGIAESLLKLTIEALKNRTNFISSHVRMDEISNKLFSKVGFNEIDQIKTEMVLKC